MSELKPVYLFSGGDRPKIATARQRLRERVGGAVETRSALETSGEEAVAACNAMGLFAEGGRAVVVTEVERWKTADVKAVAIYLRDPVPETLLVLVGEEIKRDSALAKECARAGEVHVYDVSRRGLPAWVAGQFERLGAEVEADVCRALVELVGEDLYELSSEVHKLASWAGGKRIEAADVEALAAGRAEAPPFALTDAWGRRDVAAVLAAAESLLERSSDPSRLVALLASHVGRVRTCHALDAEGVRPREAAGRLKMHPFAAEKAFAHARNFTADELRAAVVRLAEADVALKGGSRLPAELELERALVEVTRPAQPAEAAARS